MKNNQTDEFIEEIYNLSNSDFSEDIMLLAKRCLLDYLGATIAGAYIMREKGNTLLNHLDEATGRSTVIGFSRKTSIENSIFINGLSSHIAELDDGVRFGMVHPGSPIFSAILPVAEKENINGKDLLRGVITAYEATIRVASSIQPFHYNAGYHPTGTIGTIGAAIGISAMLGFSKVEMKNSFSSAVLSASGSLKVLEDGSELKPLNVANAAQKGFTSTLMSRSGFNGPDDVFQGECGFFNMMTPRSNIIELEKNVEGTLGIQKIYVKPYAACRHAHPSIEAMLEIRSKHKILEKEIDHVVIRTYKAVIGKHDHNVILGVSSAKMSIPFSAALSLVLGQAGINDFCDENLKNSEINSLLKKIKVYPDAELTSFVPEKRTAIVEVYTKDGRKFSERVDFPKGEPENPLSDKELKDKFLHLASFAGKSEVESRKIINIVWNLEEELDQLFPLL